MSAHHRTILVDCLSCGETYDAGRHPECIYCAIDEELDGYAADIEALEMGSVDLGDDVDHGMLVAPDGWSGSGRYRPRTT